MIKITVKIEEHMNDILSLQLSDEEEDSKSDESDNISAQFLKYVSRDPSQTIKSRNARAVFDYIRLESNRMVQRCTQFSWLLDLLVNDTFVTFYIRYIQLLCDTSTANYLDHPKNLAVTNFIKLQMAVWNTTYESKMLCFKLYAVEAPSYVFQLLRLRQLHPCVCFGESVLLLLTQSSIGVLHNLLNHIPDIRSLYREAQGVRTLMSYVTGDPTGGKTDTDDQSVIQYHSMRTAALLLLSIIVDESENESLNANDSHIVYLLTALDDALNRSTCFLSTKYGYQALELLKGLTNLAGSDSNKKALIEKDALKYVKSALTIARDIKFPCIPENAPVDPDHLAENALKFLWSLSFVPESHSLLTPGSDFRRLLEQFDTNPKWSSGCKCSAQGVLMNLRFTESPRDLIGDPMAIVTMMGSQQRQRRRDGHLMISYQHSSKDLMIKVRDRLRESGYSVWMDVDHSDGSFVDQMALAIEKASALILGISQAFKNSPHCHQEVKYAYILGVKMFPLQLERNFNPDGWLGLILASITYVPLTSESNLDRAMEELQKNLGDLGRSSRMTSTQLTPDLNREQLMENGDNNMWTESGSKRKPCVQEPSPHGDGSSPVKKVKPQPALIAPQNHTHITTVSMWEPADVAVWLQQVGLGHFAEKFRDVDGSMLVELARLRSVATETLCTSLRREMSMMLIDQLRLFAALAELTSTMNSSYIL